MTYGTTAEGLGAGWSSLKLIIHIITLAFTRILKLHQYMQYSNNLRILSMLGTLLEQSILEDIFCIFVYFNFSIIFNILYLYQRYLCQVLGGPGIKRLYQDYCITWPAGHKTLALQVQC
eukprot:TRINITY_DN14827_c1_g1_i1.p3 TRINITY_DN14827_c1_g1~~TRINITY_DN14827_c1_g1_i1.p3  ORF type:complete len:119 (-),score=0.30 TRINITY_DN14827_c1_g1_i1:164-520(-)